MQLHLNVLQYHCNVKLTLALSLKRYITIIIGFTTILNKRLRINDYPHNS